MCCYPVNVKCGNFQNIHLALEWRLGLWDGTLRFPDFVCRPPGQTAAPLILVLICLLDLHLFVTLRAVAYIFLCPFSAIGCKAGINIIHVYVLSISSTSHVLKVGSMLEVPASVFWVCMSPFRRILGLLFDVSAGNTSFISIMPSGVVCR